jgi:opacity protein-like surface antigen
MTRTRTLLLALILLAVSAAPARADLTAFLGATMTPANRHVTGLAVGFGLVIVGFEFEYANTTDDTQQGAPALRTGMGNVLLQTPVPIFGVQPYVTTGIGLAREEGTLNGQDHTDMSTAFNSGGGAKVDLAGPLRLRLDYRVFKMSANALHPVTHRIYVGLNLRF